MSSDFVIHTLGFMFALHTVPNPTVTISPSTSIQGAIVGSPQVITCRVTTVHGVASNSVMITWMGPGGSIISDNSDSRMTSSATTISDTSYTNRLQFAYLMEGDEGTYACSVRILDIIVPYPVAIETLSGMYGILLQQNSFNPFTNYVY